MFFFLHRDEMIHMINCCISLSWCSASLFSFQLINVMSWKLLIQKCTFTWMLLIILKSHSKRCFNLVQNDLYLFHCDILWKIYRLLIRKMHDQTCNERILNMIAKLEQVSHSLIQRNITIIQVMHDLVRIIL